MPDSISIDLETFNNDALIDERVAAADLSARGALRTALNYLYRDNGPINLPRGRLLASEPHLDLAEKIVIRWLYTRTNGSLRKTYGADALPRHPRRMVDGSFLAMQAFPEGSLPVLRTQESLTSAVDAISKDFHAARTKPTLAELSLRLSIRPNMKSTV